MLEVLNLGSKEISSNDFPRRNDVRGIGRRVGNRPGRPGREAGSLTVRRNWVVFTAFLMLQMTACSHYVGGERAAALSAETTYEKFVLRAERGDAESQNVVGFMLFYGEGVPEDRRRAQMWFLLSAEQGNERARRNLTLMNSAGATAPGSSGTQSPAVESAGAAPPGESVYMKFCAGCHGFNGISAYVHSPSFALGESLDKSDAELTRSLLRGKGEMPNWDDKLSSSELQDALRFVRTLRSRYEAGVSQSLRAPPESYYLFGPMRTRDPAGRGRVWE